MYWTFPLSSIKSFPLWYHHYPVSRTKESDYFHRSLRWMLWKLGHILILKFSGSRDRSINRDLFMNIFPISEQITLASIFDNLDMKAIWELGWIAYIRVKSNPDLKLWVSEELEWNSMILNASDSPNLCLPELEFPFIKINTEHQLNLNFSKQQIIFSMKKCLGSKMKSQFYNC